MTARNRTEVALQFAAQRITKEEFIEKFFTIPETVVRFDDERESYYDGPTENITVNVFYEVSTIYGIDAAERIARIIDTHEDSQIH